MANPKASTSLGASGHDRTHGRNLTGIELTGQSLVQQRCAHPCPPLSRVRDLQPPGATNSLPGSAVFVLLPISSALLPLNYKSARTLGPPSVFLFSSLHRAHPRFQPRKHLPAPLRPTVIRYFLISPVEDSARFIPAERFDRYAPSVRDCCDERRLRFAIGESSECSA